MDKYAFIHIPKTGGTSIIRYLENFINNTIHIDRNKPKNPNKYDLIFGHFKPELYPDRKKIIWLRHPVNRVISNYLHWQWRMKNSKKKFIIIDHGIKAFRPNTDVMTFAKETLHVYKFFTSNYNMNQFDYIGFQENMNESLEGLCSLLDITFDASKIGHYRSEQKLKNIKITKKERQNLSNLLKNDIEFYENIKKDMFKNE